MTGQGRIGGTAARPAKRKKGSLARLWLLLHGWLALPLWAYIFFICVTGTIATISHELIWVTNPDVRASRPAGVEQRLGADAMVAAVLEQRPGSRVTDISWPVETHFAPSVGIVDAGGTASTLYVNPYDGQVQGVAGTVGFRYFIRALHGWLFLPWTGGYSWGWYAVSFMGIPMLGSLITGILVYKKFWRAYFKPRLRIGKGARTFWGDFHRLAGIWSIPFVAIIGVTGTWFFIQALLSDNGITVSTAGVPVVLDRETVPQVASRADLPPVSLDAIIASAKAAHPGLHVDYLSLPGDAFSPAGIFGRGTVPLFYETASINPYDGRVVDLRRVSDKTTVELVTESMYPLHFGDFWGVGLKLVYFLFGVLLSMMVLSGMLIWTKRTARETGVFIAERRAARLEPAE
ncbi:PepSY-associated TM helix domain-containing protein [Paracoccus aminovorans]|uniref:PepSY-associated TM helix domain-containing protein n=1 Tax=Paracoccus aminovorans TaxID=34004 RepID=UPI002B25A302|nr:PepSY-associated TM helix domain-containing protein [Paracoccus aminovorans]